MSTSIAEFAALMSAAAEHRIDAPPVGTLTVRIGAPTAAHGRAYRITLAHLSGGTRLVCDGTDWMPPAGMAVTGRASALALLISKVDLDTHVRWWTSKSEARAFEKWFTALSD